MDGYATHLNATITCAIRSGILWPGSPILELGCGHYSTPLLASIARIQNRKFKVITSSTEWSRSFSNLDCEMELIEFERWQDISFNDREWGMVLLDNEETAAARYDQLFKLSGDAKAVVFHDANRVDSATWGLMTLFYKHLFFSDQYLPSTAILTQEVDPEKWF